MTEIDTFDIFEISEVIDGREKRRCGSFGLSIMLFGARD